MLIGLRVFPTYYWGSVNLLMPILIARIAGVKATGYYGAISLLFAFGCQLVVGRICDKIGHRTPALVANAIVTLLAFGVAFFHDSLVTLEIFWDPRRRRERGGFQRRFRGLSTNLLSLMRRDTVWGSRILHGVQGFFSVTSQAVFLVNISVHVPFIVAGISLIFSTGIAYKLWYMNIGGTN